MQKMQNLAKFRSPHSDSICVDLNGIRSQMNFTYTIYEKYEL